MALKQKAQRGALFMRVPIGHVKAPDDRVEKDPDGGGAAVCALAEYSQATHQDQHSVKVDYDVFVNVTRLDAKDLRNVQKLYKAEDFDFSLKPGAAAVDRGVALANVTDGFTGEAPDLGALEVGQAPPHYGPRR